MNPITIEIADALCFAQAALLVDQDEFLQDVVETRKALRIKPSIPLTELVSWKEHEPIEQRTQVYATTHTYPGQALNTAHTASVNNELLEKVMAKLPQNKKSFQLVQYIRKKYHKSEAFTPVIEAAVICGIVTDNEFPTIAHCTILDANNPFGNSAIGFVDTTPKRTDPRIAIVIDPGTSWQEVKHIYDTEFQLIKAIYQDAILKNYTDIPDVRPKIARDRQWYWMWKQEKDNGKGIYTRINNKWNNLCPDPSVTPHEEKCKHCILDINIIEQAVSNYRTFLNL